MSYTEIYVVKKNGDVEVYAEIINAWRGAMAIWDILEEKHLPPFRPSFVPCTIPDDEIEEYLTYKPKRARSININDTKEIWDLASCDHIPFLDKIVLCTTFDKVIVKKENIQKVIDAFNSFEGQTSLKEQAEILTKILEEDEYIGVTWNQTSVVRGWGKHNEEDEYEHYNINTNDDHWFLFDELKECNVI
ncbi:MAG: hypothetical protein ACOCQR_02205 [bacterium]